MAVPRTHTLRGDSCLAEEDLAAFLDGAVATGERKRIMAHLASCERCYEIFAGTAGILSALCDRTSTCAVGRVVPALPGKRPVGRALERNEDNIKHWKRARWPKVKKFAYLSTKLYRPEAPASLADALLEAFREPARLALIWHSANCPEVFSGVPVVSWWLLVLSRKSLWDRTLGDIEGQR